MTGVVIFMCMGAFFTLLLLADLLGKSRLCRPRQMRYKSGQVVTFGQSRIKAIVVESRWNKRTQSWEYHLEGFPGWIQQTNIRPI
jgi:NADH:ubiquinone oxidoreductase subunit 3 (subunit A)